MNKQHRLILFVAILASFVSFLDGSVVNVALPAITRELHGGLALQQWVVDAYILTLGSLILIAGSLSDIFGRKTVLRAGLIGFLATSLLCALAPSGELLIVGRGLQGIAGALLVPSSLALIMSSFNGPAQGKAIGSWTAWTGIAFVVGPLLGGFLVDSLSWRWIFAINVVPVIVTIVFLAKVEQPDTAKTTAKVDILGAIFCALSFGLIGYGLIEQSHYGWASPLIYGTLAAGVIAFVGFIVYESRATTPMLPLSLFKRRNFWVGNSATAAIYGGLAIATFIIVVFVQQLGHYSAVRAGLALLPVTILMFFLSSRFGALAGKHGPRLFMTAGPLLGAVGFLWMLRVTTPINYWSQLFPGIMLFGAGLSMTVAPLTAAILGSIDTARSGIASAVNNAVSRLAGLITVAALGTIIGPSLTVTSFHRTIVVTACLLVAGGLISCAGIRTPSSAGPASA